MGFSLESKHAMMDRAEAKSELSRRDDFPLQAMHLNHTKDQEYDNIEEGKIVTIIEHLKYHEWYLKNPKKIGLTKKENRSALKGMLIEILYSAHNKSFEEIATAMQEASEDWKEYLTS